MLGAHRIGPYTILAELARGGMAQIYLALRDGATEVCVLKRLLSGLALQDAAVKRFHREAHVASTLAHPNIARIIGADFDAAALYIAMEYIAGQTVDELLEKLISRGRKCSTEAALAIALSLLDGLEYAHGARSADGIPLNLVHRDLSPRNVMISYSGEVKIIDFGVARAEVDDFRTRPGVLIGTIQYFSPEQAAGEPVDHRSDLYTVSVVLYELLSGSYLVNTPGQWEMLAQIQTRDPPPLSRTDGSIPGALDRAVLRGLTKSKEARWQSAREMKRALMEAVPKSARSRPEILAELMRSIFPDGEAKLAELVRQTKMRGPEAEIDPASAQRTETAPRPTERTEVSSVSLESTFVEKTAPGAPLQDTLIRPPPPSMSTLRAVLSAPTIAALLSVSIAAALVVEAMLTGAAPRLANLVERAPDPRIDEAVKVRAVPEPEAAAGDTEARSIAEAAPQDRPRRTAHVRPPRKEDPMRSALRKRIADLRRTKDGDTFKEIYDALSERARALPADPRRRIQSAFDAALRVDSADALAAAAEELFRLEKGS